MNLVIFFEASSGHFRWIFDRKVREEAWIFRPFPGPFCCEVWKRSDAIFWEKVAAALEPFISKQGFLPCPFIRELKMETFSGRRQLQPTPRQNVCACARLNISGLFFQSDQSLPPALGFILCTPVYSLWFSCSSSCCSCFWLFCSYWNCFYG